MQNLINYSKVLIIPILVIILIPLFLSILNLFGLKTFGWLILSIMVITSIITGFKIGRKSTKKGYLQGIIIGFILVILMLIMGLFSKEHFGLHSIIYYLIIIISCSVGSMLGIQKKVNNN